MHSTLYDNSIPRNPNRGTSADWKTNSINTLVIPWADILEQPPVVKLAAGGAHQLDTSTTDNYPNVSCRASNLETD